MTVRRVVRVATSNAGKLRDFQGAAAAFGVEVRGLGDFSSITPAIEDGATFADNAKKKAAHYSQAAPGELVIADDSGLEVDTLGGAPGVHSARYAAVGDENASDEANNQKLLRQLESVPDKKRGAQFVCVIAAAKDGNDVPRIFTGSVRGMILREPRGTQGFGYDPLFLLPDIGRSFAELPVEEKAQYSHRGLAFRNFLEWYLAQK